MRALNTNPNVDNSDLVNYPGGRIKNNTGTGNGTPVNERTKGDWHQAVLKLMRRYGIIANNLPDNETNGFQIVDAIKALPSKNDFILGLSLNTGVLSVPIKLGFMETNEQVVCKANFDLDAETEIKGSDITTFTFTHNGSFKTNEYVRLIKTAGGVHLVRLVDDVSLDSMVSDLNYLKKASQAEENAGVIDTKATTPLVNLVAFTKRVIGLDSPSFLATLVRNGLYNTEHFALVEELKKVKNKGSFSNFDVDGGTIGDTFTVSGDIASATINDESSNGTSVRIVLANTMTDTNYYVKAFIQSNNSNIFDDTDIAAPIFKIINATTFDFAMREIVGRVQNLKIHFEVVKI